MISQYQMDFLMEYVSIKIAPPNLVTTPHGKLQAK
jgi:hypothetical protein